VRIRRFGFWAHIRQLAHATVGALVIAVSLVTPVALAGPAFAAHVGTLTCNGQVGQGKSISPSGAPLPAIVGVTPSVGRGGGTVAITGTCFSNVTKVLFGNQSAAFTVNDDDSITATAPSGVGGSTVPVTLEANGYAGPSSVTFSYPFGELDVSGPTPFDGYAGNDWAWYNGAGHSISLSNPGTLVFGTYSPVIHLITAFDDTGNASGATDCVVFQSQPCVYLGDGATYSADLQYCDISNDSPPDSQAACSNWDGNPGTWTYVPNGRVSETLSTPGSGRMVFGDLAVPTGGLFDEQHLAYTFRIDAGVQQTDSNNASAEAYRSSGMTSAPFIAIVDPSALVQLSVVPYTILYQPPGDQSTVTFATRAGFGTNFTLGNSTEKSNSYTTESSGSQGFSLNLSYGLGYNVNSTQNWDTTTKQSFGLTDDASQQDSDQQAITITQAMNSDAGAVPGDGGICASPTDCSQIQYPTADWLYMHEPFWLDTFVLLVHPQFAAYVSGDGKERYVMTGSVPVMGKITVGDLQSCALGQSILSTENPCEVTYGDAGLNYIGGPGPVYQSEGNYCPDKHQACVKLTPADAANLLRLDPFYGRGQNAPLPANRAILVTSQPYGVLVSSHKDPQTGQNIVVRAGDPVTVTYDNTKAHTMDAGTKTTTGTEVTDIDGSSTGGGVTMSLEPEVQTGADKGQNSNSNGNSNNNSKSPVKIGSNQGLTISGGETSTSDTAIVTSYSDSTAVSNTQETTAQVTLNDMDNAILGNNGPACGTCHGPMADQPTTTVYLDRVFGSYMFQDPGVPPPPLNFFGSALYGVDVADMVAAEFIHQAVQGAHLSDITGRSAGSEAADVLTSMGLMSTYSGNRFRPDAPFTYAELAKALGGAVKLSPPQALTTLARTSVHQEGRAVTEGIMASAIMRALGVSEKGAQVYVEQAFGPRGFSARTVVDRAHAAEILIGLLQSRCVAGCAYKGAAVERPSTLALSCPAQGQVGVPLTLSGKIGFPVRARLSLAYGPVAGSITTARDGSFSPNFTPAQVGRLSITAFWRGNTKYPRERATCVVGIVPVPPNDFSLSVTSASGPVEQGASAAGIISTSLVSGRPQGVTLSASRLPAGATATFSPPRLSAGGDSTLTIGTSSATVPGTYPITVSGASLSAKHITTYTLIVTAAQISSNISAQCSSANSSVISCSGKLTAGDTPIPDAAITLTYQPPGTGAPVVYALHTASDGAFSDEVSNSTAPLAAGIWQVQAKYAGDTAHTAVSTSTDVTVPGKTQVPTSIPGEVVTAQPSGVPPPALAIARR
jgi:hypothetical protein